MLGYCTNVHPGATPAEVMRELDAHAVGVKAIVSPDRPMGVGLWLCASAARAILADGRLGELRDFLGERGLVAYTLNGFPYGDFHGEVIKDRVYEPDWTAASRRAYTCDLAEILAGLLDEGDEGTISTLPLGWPGHARWTRQRVDEAARQLRACAAALRSLHDRSGRMIRLAIEPEPGCVIEDGQSMIEFWRAWGLTDVERRHIGVCHDICHAAVMFDGQEDVLTRYADEGLRVAKVQISNAPAIRAGSDDREEAFQVLEGFVEDRYLHQTVVADGSHRRYFNDLPEALRQATDAERECGEWRAHFHVPVYLDRIGALGTTQDQIVPAINAACRLHGTRHFEVETYAWGVLPDALTAPTLAEGLARELEWVAGHARASTSCA